MQYQYKRLIYNKILPSHELLINLCLSLIDSWKIFDVI